MCHYITSAVRLPLNTLDVLNNLVVSFLFHALLFWTLFYYFWPNSSIVSTLHHKYFSVIPCHLPHTSIELDHSPLAPPKHLFRMGGSYRFLSCCFPHTPSSICFIPVFSHIFSLPVQPKDAFDTSFNVLYLPHMGSTNCRSIIP